MSFENSCFISYRHGQRKLAERIINDLYDALSGEIELLRNEGVYLDRERLKGGLFYNEAVAESLCKSICSIVVFTPTYFDKKHTYCAREYKAMEKLEEERLRLLKDPEAKKHGLIITIVFRGADYLPPEIKERRQYYNFEDFLLCDVELSRHPSYAPKIKEIAKYIADRCRAFEGLPEDPCIGCAEFRLPTEDEIREWIETIAGPKIPFPGR